MPRRNDREEHRPMREVDLQRTTRHEPVTPPPCASGCMRSGRHGDLGHGDLVSTAVCSLACTDECPRRCRAHCRGCVPRPVDVLDDGTALAVCKGCAGRVLRAVAALPPLVAWIRSQREPSMAVGTEPMRKGKKVPPVPIRLDAVDAADELHAQLVAWCRVIVEEHPAGFRGPDLTGSTWQRRLWSGGGDVPARVGPVIGLAGIGGRLSPGIKPARSEVDDLTPAPGHEGPSAQRVRRYRDHLDAGAWVDDRGTVSPVQATESAAKWLTTHLDWALSRPWADALCAELAAVVATAEHRWPTGELPVRLPTKCPECGRASLVRHAPGWPGAHVMITCEASDCGESIRKELYDFHARLVVQEKQREVTS